MKPGLIFASASDRIVMEFGVVDRLLIILASHGHGGCEYSALSVGKFASRTLGLDVTVACPLVDGTAFLVDLLEANGLAHADLALTFEADDNLERVEGQRRRCRALLEAIRPDAVFLALPWPARGSGLIIGLAEARTPTLVKFALVPEILHGLRGLDRGRLQRAHRRQIWFANSAWSAALLERHFRLAPGSIEYFHVGPVGLVDLVGEAKAGLCLDREAARRSVREEFAVPEDALLVTTVARLAPQKGYGTYLDAVRLLVPTHPELCFLWVGEGELAAELETALSRDVLDGQVRLCGQRCDVRRLLRGSDLFVLPTLYEGGCSQALLEAMEETLPIVVSDTSGVGEVVRHEESALLVSPGDVAGLARAIERLAGDNRLRCRIAAQAGQRVTFFSKQLMIAETVARLDRLTGWQHVRHPGLASIARHGYAAPGLPRRGGRLIDRILSKLTIRR
jgi:glycosyltransferase involved in cell wall biosynthesis